MEYNEQIEKAHDFMDWLRNDQGESSWKGKTKETWITHEEWTKAMFREWALLTELPRKEWEVIYKLYLED